MVEAPRQPRARAERGRSRRRHVAKALVALLLGAEAIGGVRDAAAVPLRVRGGTSLRVLAFDNPTDVVLRGQIQDDAGASLGRVGVRIEAIDDAGKVVRMGPPLACRAEQAAGSARADGDGYLVTTDERGAFCVRKPGPAGGVRFRARFVGNNLFEATELVAPATPASEQRAETILRFEAPPGNVDLEREAVALVLSLRVDREDAARLLAGPTKREGLPIVVRDERGAEVARGTTGGDGRARIELKTQALAGPGDGELRAEFAGDGKLASSSATAPITRIATARLEAPSQLEGDPDAGIPIEVAVTSRHGAVDGGVVEATLNGSSVGAGPVVSGRAQLALTFAAAQGSVPVALRFVPSTPYHQAGPAVDVLVSVRGPSPLRQALLAAMGLALVGWIVAKWRRAPKVERHDSVLPPPPSGRPEILVVERPSGLRGWRGVVTDAHDGTAVVGAELRVVAPTFEGDGVLASTRTDESGAFSLELDAPKDARLVVEGELHATYEQLLPTPSVLRVALVTRRRALLDRLVRWARSKGTPFDSGREPTPGHVRRAASRAGVAAVESWATRLEHAAFGPEAVTREVEREIGPEPAAGRATRGDGAEDLVEAGRADR